MGDLLKPRVLSKKQAREKLEADISEAHARYERRIKLLDEQEAEIARNGPPRLGVRAQNTLRWLLAEEVGKNNFGRPIYDLPKVSDLAPKEVSKLTASKILSQPNSGHKTVSEIAAWLRHNGYELKP